MSQYVSKGGRARINAPILTSTPVQLTIILDHHFTFKDDGCSHKQTHFTNLSLSLCACSVQSDALQPHELQHARPPCPSPTSGACSNSCPLSRSCHRTISSSVIPFYTRFRFYVYLIEILPHLLLNLTGNQSLLLCIKDSDAYFIELCRKEVAFP